MTKIISLLIISYSGILLLKGGVELNSIKTGEADRVWKMKDYGVLPNTGECLTSRVQHLIDSAYTLKGVTSFSFEPGAYHFSYLIDFTKKRGPDDPWAQFICVGNTLFSECDAK